MIGAIDGRNAMSLSARTVANGSRSIDFASLVHRSTEAGDDALRRSASPGPTAADTTKFDDALAAFRKEAAMTRQERIRRDVLEAMELTEEAVDAMPPERQKEVEEKIAAEVARRIRLAEGDTMRAPTPLA